MSVGKRLRAGSFWGSLLLMLFSNTHLAHAAFSSTVIAISGTAGYASGGMYGGSLWLKSGNKILKYAGSGSVTTEYTIPTTINGVSAGTFGSYQSDVDVSTGIMYFSSGSAPIKIWSFDLNNLGTAPALLFSGFNSSQCNAFASGILAFNNELYFACPDAYTLSNNKLYKFTIPAPGATALGTANLTTVATSPVVRGFWDLEYRSQDGRVFTLMGEGASGTNTYIAKLNPTASLPTTLTSVKTSTVSGGAGGITGFDIDSVGNIFYATYQSGTGTTAGYQITRETPTVSVSATYSLPTNDHSSIYSHDWILDQGSQSTSGTVIGYVTNGGGGVVKVSGAAVSNYISVGDLIIQSSTISFSIPNGIFIYRQSYIFSAVANTAGKVYFYVNNKPIAGCKGKAVNSSNSYTADCTFKPSNHGGFLSYVKFIPTASNYTSSESSRKTILVSRRTSQR